MIYSNAVKMIKKSRAQSPEAPPSLLRFKLMLRLLGDPQKKQRVLLVGGSRAKYSVSNMIASILSCEGYKVALVGELKPNDPKESLYIGGRAVTPDAFCRALDRVSGVLQSIKQSYDEVLNGASVDSGINSITQLFVSRRISPEPVTEELFMAAIACILQDEGCDICVIPSMAGGRNSPVCAFPPPIAALILSLDAGASATAELFAITKGVKEVVSESQTQQNFLALSQKCADSGARLTVTASAEIKISRRSLLGTEFTYRGKEALCIPSPIAEMVHRAASVVELSEVLSRNGFQIGAGSVKNGLKAYAPRTEMDIYSISADPIVLFCDGGLPQGDIVELLSNFPVIRCHLGGKLYILDEGADPLSARRIMRYAMENMWKYYDEVCIVCGDESGFLGFGEGKYLGVRYESKTLPEIVLSLETRDTLIGFCPVDKIGRNTEKIRTALERRHVVRREKRPFKSEGDKTDA